MRFLRDVIISTDILPVAVSYNNQKLKLKWSDERVTVNPELKLLQYFMDHRLKLEETDSITSERSGNSRTKEKRWDRKIDGRPGMSEGFEECQGMSINVDDCSAKVNQRQRASMSVIVACL